MSISGISSSLSDLTSQNVQSMMQQLKQDFTQLGTDLKAGNLGAAQQDFVTLQQDSGQSTSASSTSQSQDPIAQAFNQLSKDLQSGNVSAAQQDYSTIQQAFQTIASQHGTAAAHHHHDQDGDNDGSVTSTSSQASQVSQLFTQLGQELQSGNVNTAQQTYITLQQDFQNSQASTQPTSTKNLSVSA